MIWVVAIAIAYFAGTVPTAQIVAARVGHDPTAEGSGNPGASNVYRVAGARAGITVFLIDVAKGALPTALGWALDGRALGVACWVAAVVGHIFPLTRRFRGGKGVATAGGGALVLYPLVSVVCLLVFAFVLRVAKLPSVGSLAMAAVLLAGVVVRGSPGWEIIATVGLSALVVARHRANIGRLIGGTENRYTTGGTER